MKLFSCLIATALAGDRAFSNYPPFLTDGKDTASWKNNDQQIAKFNRLAPATELFYDTFYAGNDKAKRFATHMEHLLRDVRNDIPRQLTRCDRRSKRPTSLMPNYPSAAYPTAYPTTDGYTLPVEQGIKKGYEALYYQYARWVREEIYWDCPFMGMRIFKRLDRLRWLSVYFYCARVDDTEGFCKDTYFLNGVPKQVPRKSEWFTNYWGRHSLIAYDGVACENADNGPTELAMACPVNHDIRVVSAQYGRFNPNSCTKNVDKSTLEMCSAFVNVESVVAAECNGGDSCDVQVNNLNAGSDPCPNIPKYTRIRWICDPSSEFLTYGN